VYICSDFSYEKTQSVELMVEYDWRTNAEEFGKLREALGRLIPRCEVNGYFQKGEGDFYLMIRTVISESNFAEDH
jgi:hypothetical protein